MKRLFLLFFSAMLCTVVSAHDFEVDGIYYNITSDTDLTVEVTYPFFINSNNYVPSDDYHGDIIIPENVIYKDKQYHVTSIGEAAFLGCENQLTVTIPNSVKYICASSFQDASKLTNVTILDGNESLYIKNLDTFSIFHNIPNISLIIGRNIEYENTYLGPFNNHDNPISITFRNTISKINNNMFRNCHGLKKISIPKSVISIGQGAFFDCTELTEVNITDLTAWCKIEFGSYSSNPTYYAHKLYLNGEEITNLVIPYDVTTIGKHTFNGCSRLKTVTLHNSIAAIGDGAFSGCSTLASVYITDLSKWCKINIDGPHSNPIYYANHLYLNGKEIINLVIPDDVTSIGNYAFYGCSELTSVTIPNSVSSIGGSAFYGCSGLKSLRFEDGEPTLTFSDNFSNTIDSLYLGRNIAVKSSYFNTGENKLSVLSIGKYVVCLDDKMFYYCNNITKVISYATEPPIAYPLTFTTDIYGKATLSVPGESMEKYRNADVWKKFYKIEEIDNNPDATEQCAVPVITYAEGKLQFACETAGGECKYTLTAKDIQTAFITANNNSVDLTACYDITAYAVAEGYKNSEKVNATLYWIDGSDVSTNINQTEMRGVMATCSGGIITVSGLTDGESVMFYDANGALLYTGTAQNGTISYAPSASGVIIVKIGTTSIKVVN